MMARSGSRGFFFRSLSDLGAGQDLPYLFGDDLWPPTVFTV